MAELSGVIGETTSIQGACKLAGVSRRTIYNWIAGKRVTVYRTPGGNVRLLKAELVKLDQPAVAVGGAYTGVGE